MSKIEILKHNNHRFMWMDDYLWMWDTPQECELQKELADQSFGNVLVAGYGFGILPKYLLQNPKVNSITVVEKYREVIDEIAKEDKIIGDIIIGDYYDMPESVKFDCVIGDIWPDISSRFLDDYVNFKDKARRLLKKEGEMLAWGKDFFEYLLEKQL